MNTSRDNRFRFGESDVIICRDEFELGRTAAAAVGDCMRRLLCSQDRIHVTVATGESQATFLDALAQEQGIAWDRVVCFSIDDFHHPSIPEQYTCGHQVEKQLWSKVKPGVTHRVRANAEDPVAEAARFEQEVRKAGPMDILCQGIGTSGHLALNEPFDADFNDSAMVKVVRIADQSKRQLMLDPNFRDLGFIPDHGITMTIPAILSSRHVFTMVPLALKRPILTRLFTLQEPTIEVPASILLRKKGSIFVDRNSCPEFQADGAGAPSQATA